MFPTFLHEIQMVTTAIPSIARILVLKKIALRENCVGGTILMIQLTRNSPICGYKIRLSGNHTSGNHVMRGLGV